MSNTEFTWIKFWKLYWAMLWRDVLLMLVVTLIPFLLITYYGWSHHLPVSTTVNYISYVAKIAAVIVNIIVLRMMMVRGYGKGKYKLAIIETEN